MNLFSAIAIYFIIWWLVLFLTLPFGVRNSHEAGEDVLEGNEPGAPVVPHLWRKVLATSILAAIVFAGVYYVYTTKAITLDDFWFLGPK